MDRKQLIKGLLIGLTYEKTWVLLQQGVQIFNVTDVVQIRDIQGFLDTSRDGSKEASPFNLPEAPDIVFETGQPLTVADACLSLPPRPVVDRLVSFYLNSAYLRTRKHIYLGGGPLLTFPAFIHSKKFLREVCHLR